MSYTQEIKDGAQAMLDDEVAVTYIKTTNGSVVCIYKLDGEPLLLLRDSDLDRFRDGVYLIMQRPDLGVDILEARLYVASGFLNDS